jgi:hypothetical protein
MPICLGDQKHILNWIMLDEQFNYVKSKSGAKPVERPEEVLPLVQPKLLWRADICIFT